MTTIRLTASQAMVRFLSAQRVEIDGKKQRLFEGVFAIFGHGNVAGMGEALFAARDTLPTYRAHNEQAMAHAAIAFAKASRRRRMMACTTSIGPGATNMVTAAAVAHVNRLPVLLPPGVMLFRPHHAARADHRGAAARDERADRPGNVRAGDLGAVPGHAGGGLRLSAELFRRA